MTLRSVLNKVYVMVGCPSVRLSHRSTAAAAARGFAAERPADRRYQSIAVGASAVYLQQARSAANAGSVALRAERGGSTQTCSAMYIDNANKVLLVLLLFL